MAFLKGIFGNNQNQGQQQPQQQQPGQNQLQQPQGQNQQQGPQQGNQGPANGNGSGGPAGQQQGPANSSFQGGGQNGQNSNPMDAFMNLLNPSPEVKQQWDQQQQQQNQGLFGDGFTPEAINAAVGKTNFAGNLDPARVQAALSGDVNAFNEVLNSAIANGVSTALQGSRGMVEHGVKTGSDRFSSSLDSRFRNYQLRNQNPNNAALQHPIGKALMGTISQQIAKSQPNMSPQDVTAKSEELFTEFAKMMLPQQSSDSKNSQQSGPDWSTFLDDPSQ